LYGLDSRGPDEGFRTFIPDLEESSDRRLEIVDAEEDTALDCFVVEVTEPPLDEIHPTGTGGDEMRHIPGMAFQPRRHFLVLMGAVVVHDQMERNVAGKLLIESTQELQKFLMPVSLMAFTDNFTL
jgi:hypothetical protein